MEKAERMRKLLAERFGITTDAELEQALEETEPVDLGIFVTPYRTEKGKKCSKDRQKTSGTYSFG